MTSITSLLVGLGAIYWTGTNNTIWEQARNQAIENNPRTRQYSLLMRDIQSSELALQDLASKEPGSPIDAKTYSMHYDFIQRKKQRAEELFKDPEVKEFYGPRKDQFRIHSSPCYSWPLFGLGVLACTFGGIGILAENELKSKVVADTLSSA